MATYTVPALPKVSAPQIKARQDAYINPQPVLDRSAEVIQQGQDKVMSAVKQWSDYQLKNKEALKQIISKNHQFRINQYNTLGDIPRGGNAKYDTDVRSMFYTDKDKLAALQIELAKNEGDRELQEEFFLALQESQEFISTYSNNFENGIIPYIASITEAMTKGDVEAGAMSSLNRSVDVYMAMALAGKNNIPIETYRKENAQMIKAKAGTYKWGPDMGGGEFKIEEDAEINLNLLANRFTEDVNSGFATIPDVDPFMTSSGEKSIGKPGDPTQVANKYTSFIKQEKPGYVNVSGLKGMEYDNQYVDALVWAEQVPGEIVNGKQTTMKYKEFLSVQQNNLTGGSRSIRNPITYARDDNGFQLRDPETKELTWEVDPAFLVDGKFNTNIEIGGYHAALQDTMEMGTFDDWINQSSQYPEPVVLGVDVWGRDADGNPGALNGYSGFPAADEDTNEMGFMYYHSAKNAVDLFSKGKINKESNPFGIKSSGSSLTPGQTDKLNLQLSIAERALSTLNILNLKSVDNESTLTSKDPQKLLKSNLKTLPTSWLGDEIDRKKTRYLKKSDINPNLFFKKNKDGEFEQDDDGNKIYRKKVEGSRSMRLEDEYTNVIRIVTGQPTYTREQIYKMNKGGVISKEAEKVGDNEYVLRKDEFQKDAAPFQEYDLNDERDITRFLRDYGDEDENQLTRTLNLKKQLYNLPDPE